MGIPLYRIKSIRTLYGEDPQGDSVIDFGNANIRPTPWGHVIAARITSENPEEGKFVLHINSSSICIYRWRWTIAFCASFIFFCISVPTLSWVATTLRLRLRNVFFFLILLRQKQHFAQVSQLRNVKLLWKGFWIPGTFWCLVLLVLLVLMT